MRASATTKYAAACADVLARLSDGGSGTSTRTGTGLRAASADSAASRPRSVEDGRVDAADQVAQLGERLLDLAVRVLQGRGGLRVARRLAPGAAQLDAERHEPLLGAVVQVALDAAALLVGGTDRGRAGLGQLHRATLGLRGPRLRLPRGLDGLGAGRRPEQRPRRAGRWRASPACAARAATQRHRTAAGTMSTSGTGGWSRPAARATTG